MPNKDHRLLAKLGTLRQIEIFLKVAELSSIARASEQLHLTQPTVSIQVKKLSEAIGLPLYEVIGKRLKLTEAGEAVAKAGRELFETVNELDDRINDLKGMQSGTLNLAVVTTAKYFMPYILGPFCELYPGVEVKINIGNRREIIDRLNANMDDLYFVNELPDDLDIRSYPFLPNPVAVIASRDHRLALRKRLKWKDIENERFILREAGSGTLVRVQDFLAKNGYQINNSMEIQSNEAIKHAVMANMGISIISAYILGNADSDGLTQLNVEAFPIMSQWQLAHLQEKRLSTVAKRFLEFTTDNVSDLLPMQKIEANIQLAMKGIWGRER